MEIIFMILKLLPAVLIPALICVLVVYVNEKVKKEEEDEGEVLRTKSSKTYKIFSSAFLAFSAVLYATVIVILNLYSHEFSTLWYVIFCILMLVVVVVPTFQVLTALTTYETICEDGIMVRRLSGSKLVKYEDLYCYRTFIDQIVVFDRDCKKAIVIDNSRIGVNILLSTFADKGIFEYKDETEEQNKETGADKNQPA